jgi:hypothetical protein
VIADAAVGAVILILLTLVLALVYLRKYKKSHPGAAISTYVPSPFLGEFYLIHHDSFKQLRDVGEQDILESSDKTGETGCSAPVPSKPESVI